MQAIYLVLCISTTKLNWNHFPIWLNTEQCKSIDLLHKEGFAFAGASSGAGTVASLALYSRQTLIE